MPPMRNGANVRIPLSQLGGKADGFPKDRNVCCMKPIRCAVDAWVGFLHFTKSLSSVKVGTLRFGDSAKVQR